MVITVIFHNSQKVETTPVSTHRKMDKLWRICKMEYYSAFRRKDALTSATTWLYIEDIMFFQMSQPNHMILPTRIVISDAEAGGMGVEV